MKIALASDHAGAALKANLVEYVASGPEAGPGGRRYLFRGLPAVCLAAREGVADGRYDRHPRAVPASA